ncbi:hypothetical protein D3C72_2187440 [compost metagenome]
MLLYRELAGRGAHLFAAGFGALGDRCAESCRRLERRTGHDADGGKASEFFLFAGGPSVQWRQGIEGVEQSSGGTLLAVLISRQLQRWQHLGSVCGDHF